MGAPPGLFAIWVASDSSRLACTSSTKRALLSQRVARISTSNTAADKNAMRQSAMVVIATMNAGAAAQPI